MRKFFLRCTTVLILGLLASPARSQLQKLYIHPKAAGNEKQSQFIDHIRFIPLEPKEGIDVASYSNITVTANYFLIEDYSGQKLLLYSKEGAFVKKISYKHLGENFYPRYLEDLEQIVFLGPNKNYALTQKDQLLIRMNWSDARNKKYFRKYIIDLRDPELAIKKGVISESDINLAHKYYDDYFWSSQITTSPLFSDSLDYELKLFKNNELVKGFFPYNRINEPRFLYTESSATLIKTLVPSVGFITRPYCDTIYKIEKDSLYPAFKLVLPLENSLPPSFFTRQFKNKTERENFEGNNGWTFSQIRGFYENNRYLLFAVQYHTNYETYVYHKATGTAYKSRNIKTDSSQYNLTLLGEFGNPRKGDLFYKLQKVSDLTTFFEEHKTVAVPKELESFLNSKPQSASPVIVEFKLKN